MNQVGTDVWPEEQASYSPLAVEIYSVEYVAELRREFEIPDAKEQEFYGLLARTTRHYTWLKQAREDVVERKAVRNQLRSLAKKSDAAGTHLSQLLKVHSAALDREYFALTRDVVEDEESILRKIGAANTRHDDLGGVEVLTLEDAVAAFSMVSLICAQALDSLPPNKRGPKENFPLVSWVRAHCEFWKNELGRKPTLDVHDGQMTSRTGAFLSALIRPLDPDAEQSIPHAFAEARKR